MQTEKFLLGAEPLILRQLLQHVLTEVSLGAATLREEVAGEWAQSPDAHSYSVERQQLARGQALVLKSYGRPLMYVFEDVEGGASRTVLDPFELSKLYRSIQEAVADSFERRPSMRKASIHKAPPVLQLGLTTRFGSSVRLLDLDKNVALRGDIDFLNKLALFKVHRTGSSQSAQQLRRAVQILKWPTALVVEDYITGEHLTVRLEELLALDHEFNEIAPGIDPQEAVNEYLGKPPSFVLGKICELPGTPSRNYSLEFLQCAPLKHFAPKTVTLAVASPATLSYLGGIVGTEIEGEISLLHPLVKDLAPMAVLS